MGDQWRRLLANALGVAWVWASYFGQAGHGIADVLFGKVPFSGALPFMIPQRARDFGNIDDYSMTAAPYGKTYRYWRYVNSSAIPLYPFAFGLSLCEEMVFSALSFATHVNKYCPEAADCVTPQNDTVTATVSIKNSDSIDGTTVVTLFGTFLGPEGQASTVPALHCKKKVYLTTGRY